MEQRFQKTIGHDFKKYELVLKKIYEPLKKRRDSQKYITQLFGATATASQQD